MKKIVMKFGGASLKTGENIRHVANLIANYHRQDYRILVVVSALDGVTDNLVEAAEQAKNGNGGYVSKFRQQISERHLAAVREAVESKLIREEVERITETTIDELEKVLTGIVYVGELTPKSRDYVLSFGERLSTPIVWGSLRDLKLETQYYSGGEAGIVTDANFGEASPLMNVTTHQVREKIEPLLEKRIIPVITGDVAATQDGVTTTLGRGGSDYTATIIGAALTVGEVWIWTDVDGLMTADPKIVPSAKMMPELSFYEATEMAIFGAKTMHPKALEPAIEGNVAVRIRNVFNLENPGTLITKEQKIKPVDVVKAIALIKDVAIVNVSGAGMIGAPGSYAKVFEVLGKNNVNVMMISSAVSEANISFVIRRNLLERAISTLEITLLGRGVISEVTAEDDVCVVAVMGAGMKGTLGVSSRIFTAAAREGINIRMIAQGSSELNVSLAVKEVDGERLVRAIHKEFKLDKN